MDLVRSDVEVLCKFIFTAYQFGGAPEYLAMDLVASHTTQIAKRVAGPSLLFGYREPAVAIRRDATVRDPVQGTCLSSLCASDAAAC
jgi:hypothetical protein